jgi:hypothetical protein
MTAWDKQAHRFWSNIQRCRHGNACPACCWPWLGAHDRAGYARGRYGVGGRWHEVYMHRAAYRFWWGGDEAPIAPGQGVYHRCARRDCCNPSHLWIGTHAENIAEREAKGRGWRGERASRPKKLTVAQATQIRELWGQGQTTRSLATQFSVSQPLISRILQRKVWAWGPKVGAEQDQEREQESNSMEARRRVAPWN